MRPGEIFASVAVVTAAISLMAPMEAQASMSYDMRERVIELSGIMDTYGAGESVTRGEFAQMLVKASDQRSVVSSTSNVSVFSDVPKDSEYASYIRIAAQEGWMSGYLGGLFKPDEYITMQDATKAILALLGYTDEDFTGDQVNGRKAQFEFLELNEEIDRESDEVLTKSDCINLFYNLLRTESKGSTTIYGSILDCELTEDGEINPLNMVDNSMNGSRLVRRTQNLTSIIPFDVSEASFFLNGSSARLETIKSALQNDGFGVIYWNSSTKTVWYYSADSDDEDTGRVVVRGEVTHIYYNSADVMVPSSVLLDNDDEEDPQAEYVLSSSEMQYAFSMYGTVQVGDDVVLICEKTTNSDGEPSYRVVDFLEE